MGIHSKLVIKESVGDLELLVRKQAKVKNIDRLRSLICIKTNKFETRQQLAGFLGYHIRTMERWLSVYEQEGLAKMLIPEKLDRDSHLINLEVHQEISKRVNDPLAGFSSYVEVQQWLSTEHKLDVQYHTIRAYLIRHFKTKIKRPRKSHIKKDDQAVEAFLKTT